MNGHLRWCDDLQARLANFHEWVWVSLGAPFIQPCATYEQKHLVDFYLMNESKIAMWQSLRHVCLVQRTVGKEVDNWCL